MKLPVTCPERECCCGKKGCTPGKGLPKIVLIGNPNVGKSSLFNLSSAFLSTEMSPDLDTCA